MDFRSYLRIMVEKDASDLYLSSGAAVSAKIDGTLQALEDGVLTPEQVKDVAWSIMNNEQIAEFEHKPEMNLAISEEGIGRFRVNIFRQRNSISMVIRNINFFPEERRNQLLLDLSLNLRAFVSQRLIKTVDGKRAAAVEILLGTPLVQDMIRRGDVHEIKEVMQKSENLGMQTFDRALYRLVENGSISAGEALKNADSPNNLRLSLSLNTDKVEKKASPADLSLIAKEEPKDEEEDELAAQI